MLPLLRFHRSFILLRIDMAEFALIKFIDLLQLLISPNLFVCASICHFIVILYRFLLKFWSMIKIRPDSLYWLIQPIKLCPELYPKDVQNSRDKFKAFSRSSLFILQYFSLKNPAIGSSISLAFNFVHYVRVSTVTFSTGHGQYRNFQL